MDDDDFDEEYYANDEEFVDEEVNINKAKRFGGKTGNRRATSVTGSQARVVVDEYSSIHLDDDILPSYYQDYSLTLKLKPDHENRPIWVTRDNLIFLEAFSPLYQQACDFLVAIAEPESRPNFIHTYRLTENSLYAAVAVSITTDAIIKVLSKLCKTNLPPEVENFIRRSTYTFGKAKIVLKDNTFFIESKYPEVLRELLKNPVIKGARETKEADGNNANDSFLESSAPVEDIRNLEHLKLGLDEGDVDDDDDEELTAATSAVSGGFSSRMQTVSFMIKQSAVQTVKRSAKEESNYPLMEEYDFKNDHRNPVLQMDLRPSTRIRVSGCSDGERLSGDN